MIVDSDTSRAIQNWWKAFTQKTAEIDALFSRRKEWDLPEWMHEHLGAIHPALMWEYGPAVNTDGHRLVITPESRRELRPLVREILRQAPQLVGWEFYEYRLAESLEQAISTVEGRAGVDVSAMTFLAQPGRFRRVDLQFSLPDAAVDEEQVFEAAFVATEALLGEEVLDHWIGAIEMVKPGRRAQRLHRPIAELPDHVRSLIDDVESDLPEDPLQPDKEDLQWSGFEFRPEEADEYPGQSDLIAGITMYPDMWENAVSGASFSSRRYSRCGEIFCYLKIGREDDSGQSPVEAREELENALQAGLKGTQLGGVIGGGTGIRYSYIELALRNVDEAVALIQDLLQSRGVPLEAWLLFHDDELAAEWIGIWEESPPPPTVDDEEEE